MNTKEGYAKKSLANVNVLGAGGGDISILNLKGLTGAGVYDPIRDCIIPESSTGSIITTIKSYSSCFVSFKFGALNRVAACGLADVPVANSGFTTNSNHFVWVCDGSSVKMKYPGGISAAVAAAPLDIFSVEYRDDFVIFRKNGESVFVYPDDFYLSNGMTVKLLVKGFCQLTTGTIENFECNTFPINHYPDPYLLWTSSSESATSMQPNTTYKIVVGHSTTLLKTPNSLLKSGGTMTGTLTTPSLITTSLSVSGAATFSQAINGSILGNAATASRLQNSRIISLTGSVYGSSNFDGSADISIETVSNTIETNTAYLPESNVTIRNAVSSDFLDCQITGQSTTTDLVIINLNQPQPASGSIIRITTSSIQSRNDNLRLVLKFNNSNTLWSGINPSESHPSSNNKWYTLKRYPFFPNINYFFRIRYDGHYNYADFLGTDIKYISSTGGGTGGGGSYSTLSASTHAAGTNYVINGSGYTETASKFLREDGQWQSVQPSLTDDLLDGSALKYAPYSSRQNSLCLYTGTTAPNGTTRLNLNGYLYATKLYSDGNEVQTTAVSAPSADITLSTSNKTYITVGSTARKIKLPSTCPWSISLSGLYDTSISSLSSGQYLKYNGTNWVNASLPKAGSWAESGTGTLGISSPTLSIDKAVAAGGASVTSMPQALYYPGNDQYYALPVIIDSDGQLFVAISPTLAGFVSRDKWSSISPK